MDAMPVCLAWKRFPVVTPAMMGYNMSMAKRIRSEKTKESNRAYRKAHRAEIDAKTKAWAKANPDKVRAYQRAYKQRNAAKIANQKRVWRKQNPEKHRAANQRWKINRRMKICDFDSLLNSQGGLCAICGTNKGFSGGGDNRRLAIDHCHTTGAVRGLLCGNCNRMLGLVKDSVETLKNAIKYLEKQI